MYLQEQVHQSVDYWPENPNLHKETVVRLVECFECVLVNNAEAGKTREKKQVDLYAYINICHQNVIHII